MYMVIFGGIRWGIHWSSWLVVLGHKGKKTVGADSISASGPATLLQHR